MKRPAVFFDRDNTLILSDGYLGDPARVTLVSGAADAVARARKAGYAVVVFSNQSGVARGMFSEEDVQAVNSRMDELLIAENAGAVIDRHEFCPFHPDGTVDIYARESDRRKPKPGMILSAADKLALDLSRSWVIGDAGRDIEAGKAAGCRAILFSDAAMKKSPAAEAPSNVEPDYTVTTLAEALTFIEQHVNPTAADVQAVKPVAALAGASEPVRDQLPPLAPSVATMSISTPATENSAASTPQDPPTAAPTPPRVPKVVIGSKYVPPAGKPVHDPAPAAPREIPPTQVAPRKSTTADDDDDRPAAPPATGFERMENTLEQIFLELRRQHEHHQGDFSVSKLLAGVVQMLVVAILLISYFKRDSLDVCLQLALVLQTMTIALLIMSRQK